MKNWNKDNKELLLKDLCTRLPYNCRVFYEYVDDLDGKTYGYSLTLNTWCIDEFIANKAIIKPYLRSLSSMTKEEEKEYENCFQSDDTTSATLLVDFYNKNHFDYRGLIEKSLAIEAPKEMYK